MEQMWTTLTHSTVLVFHFFVCFLFILSDKSASLSKAHILLYLRRNVQPVFIISALVKNLHFYLTLLGHLQIGIWGYNLTQYLRYLITVANKPVNIKFMVDSTFSFINFQISVFANRMRGEKATACGLYD